MIDHPGTTHRPSPPPRGRGIRDARAHRMSPDGASVVPVTCDSFSGKRENLGHSCACARAGGTNEDMACGHTRTFVYWNPLRAGQQLDGSIYFFSVRSIIHCSEYKRRFF